MFDKGRRQDASLMGTWYNICPFMTIGLGLHGAQLLVYAVIYSYTVDRKQGFCRGGANYIGRITGTSPRTVYRCFDELLKMGLIEEVSMGEISGYRAKVREDGSPTPSLCELSKKAKKTTEGGTRVKKKAESPERLTAKCSSDLSALGGGSPEGIAPLSFGTAYVGASGKEKTDFCAREPNVEKLEHSDTVTEKTDIGTDSSHCQPDSDFLPKGQPISDKTSDSIRYSKREVTSTSSSSLSAYARERKFVGKFFSEDEEEENRPEREVKYRVYTFGPNGRVFLTDDQYEILAGLVDDDTLLGYIYKLDAFLVKPDGHVPHSHYRTLRSWIEKDLSCDT